MTAEGLDPGLLNGCAKLLEAPFPEVHYVTKKLCNEGCASLLSTGLLLVFLFLIKADLSLVCGTCIAWFL